MDEITDFKLLSRLFTAIGKSEVRGEERSALELAFRGIKIGYLRDRLRPPPVEIDRHKELLQKYRANTAERRELRQQLGEFGKQEIVRADEVLANMLPQAQALLTGDQQPDDRRVMRNLAMIVELLEDREDRDIRFLLYEASASPQKTRLRVTVIEPFLLVLELYHLWESSRPLTETMEALFDWVGVENKCPPRPTPSGFKTIVREFRKSLEPNFLRDMEARWVE